MRRPAAILVAGAALVAAAPAIPDQHDIIARASILDSDPADFDAVNAVCTQCHVASQFLDGARSSGRWEETYAAMARNGAHPTPDQIDRIVRYFQRNLTIINERRAAKPFANIADLGTVAGIDKTVLAKLESRKLLQF
jgi:hypothetical protein